jgi:hypothetical protein
MVRKSVQQFSDRTMLKAKARQACVLGAFLASQRRVKA